MFGKHIENLNEQLEYMLYFCYNFLFIADLARMTELEVLNLSDNEFQGPVQGNSPYNELQDAYIAKST